MHFYKMDLMIMLFPFLWPGEKDECLSNGPHDYAVSIPVDWGRE
jgi:hypothetical protein